MHLLIILFTYLFHKYLLKSICKLIYKCPFKLALVSKITKTMFKVQYIAVQSISEEVFLYQYILSTFVYYLKSHNSPVQWLLIPVYK